MKLKPALRETLSNNAQNKSCLLSATAMQQSVVSISAPRDGGIILAQPPIKGIVQKKVGKEWADNPTLRCPFLAGILFPIRIDHRRC